MKNFIQSHIASAFSILSTVSVYVPALQPYLPIFVTIAGFFGVTGLTQAAKAGSLSFKE